MKRRRGSRSMSALGTNFDHVGGVTQRDVCTWFQPDSIQERAFSAVGRNSSEAGCVGCDVETLSERMMKEGMCQ